jgi:hypothetical protein
MIGYQSRFMGMWTKPVTVLSVFSRAASLFYHTKI